MVVKGEGGFFRLPRLANETVAEPFSTRSGLDQIKETAMPRGGKSAYTDKQKRQAGRIEDGYEKKGVSRDEAERRAWTAVNKQDGGGKKSGSGRGR